jgi:hypothetical protein
LACCSPSGAIRELARCPVSSKRQGRSPPPVHTQYKLRQTVSTPKHEGPSLAVPFAPHGTQVQAAKGGPSQGGGECSSALLLCDNPIFLPSSARIPFAPLSYSCRRHEMQLLPKQLLKKRPTPELCFSPCCHYPGQREKRKRPCHAPAPSFKIAMVCKNQGQPSGTHLPDLAVRSLWAPIRARHLVEMRSQGRRW